MLTRPQLSCRNQHYVSELCCCLTVQQAVEPCAIQVAQNMLTLRDCCTVLCDWHALLGVGCFWELDPWLLVLDALQNVCSFEHLSML